MENLLGLPVDASTHGAQIDQLINWVHVVMAVLFVGWGLYFLFVLWRFRAKKNPVASYEGAKGKFAKGTEVAVALVEALLLIAFAIPAWAKWTQEVPEEADAVRLRVVAQQFAWNIHYPGEDGVFGASSPMLIGPTNVIGLDPDDPFSHDDIVTINQLHLPVDKQILIGLSSIDVIHSFALPQMRVKQDAVPGMRIPIQFTAAMTTPEGEIWNIACAQLCGNSHYRMKGYYTIHSLADYEAWLRENAPEPPAASEPVVDEPMAMDESTEGDEVAANDDAHAAE